jgi:hypothetical protein
MRAVKAIFSSVTWIVALLYAAWWIVTAVAVVNVLWFLFQSVITAWIDASGFRKFYLAGGALTLVLLIVKFGPATLRESFRLVRSDPIQLNVAVVMMGGILMLLIPLAVIAWPVSLGYLLLSYSVPRARPSRRS